MRTTTRRIVEAGVLYGSIGLGIAGIYAAGCVGRNHEAIRRAALPADPRWATGPTVEEVARGLRNESAPRGQDPHEAFGAGE